MLVRVLGGTILAMTSLSLLSQDWLSGRLVAETFLRGGETTRDATPNSMDVAIAVGVAVTHAFVAMGVWLRTVRGFAVLVGTGLYLGLFAVTRMDTTSLLMCWVLFAFLAPEAIDRGLAFLHGDSDTGEKVHS